MVSDKIRVMISSRCKDYAASRGATFPLSRIRKALRDEIGATKLFGEPLFDCWINELEPAKPVTRDVWDECMHEVRRAHILIALVNGDAGWASQDEDIGICHAELAIATQTGRDRTQVVQLPPAKADSARDRRFQKFVARELPFTGAPALTEADVITNVRLTLAEAVARLTRGGAMQVRRDSYSLGQALEWSKLDYVARKAVMEETCLDALVERAGGEHDRDAKSSAVVVHVDRSEVLFCVHAIPAAASVAAARELVGKPFLSDYRRIYDDAPECGPVHLIACQKSITEKQATDLLGFPDATVVPTTFGVYLVDPIQKIQLVLLANCRDDTSTRYAVQRMFDWLGRSGETAALVRRAKARKKIVGAIRKEL